MANIVNIHEYESAMEDDNCIKEYINSQNADTKVLTERKKDRNKYKTREKIK